MYLVWLTVCSSFQQLHFQLQITIYSYIIFGARFPQKFLFNVKYTSST